MVIMDIPRPSSRSSLGLAPTRRALPTTSPATLVSNLELGLCRELRLCQERGLCLDSNMGLGLCLVSSQDPMELLPLEASMLTPTAERSQARATPAPLSDEDKEMELVKHFRLPLLLCNL